MRKTDIRKWVHGILDLLPLLVIPVFMVYSHRHTIDSNSVTIAQNSIVNIKQDVLNGKPNNKNNWSFTDDEEFFYLQDSYMVFFTDETSQSISTETKEMNINLNDKVLFKANIKSTNITYFDISLSDSLFIYEGDSTVQDNRLEVIVESDDNYVTNDVLINVSDTTSYFYIKNVQVFNLTQMYGSGNEPTIEQFNNAWKQDYYSVDSHAKTLVKGTSTVTYNDTDIGSQFVYSLYNVTNNYFNFNNVFGFGNLQDWFMLNIFGGNAPLSFYIVWQVVLYEFLMDLIFLIYGLFMWFIDMCEKLMNKPLNAIK